MTLDASNAAPMANPPTTENRTVPPRRRANADYRTREYLTKPEVDMLVQAARSNARRYGHRDATMILLAYRHALRVTELVNLQWSDVDLKAARLHVRRVKRSISGVHPIMGDELRALRKLRTAAPDAAFVFTTERGGTMSEAAFRKLLTRVAAAVPSLSALKVHPHALRHATGYVLANGGKDTRTIQDYMGHAQISNTVRYTTLNSTRFKDMGL